MIDQAYKGTRGTRPEDIWRHSRIGFSKVAESFGCLGTRVEHPNDLNEVLRQALSANRPVVVDVVSDEQAFAREAWKP